MFKLNDAVTIHSAQELSGKTGTIKGVSYTDAGFTMYIVLMDEPVSSGNDQNNEWEAITITEHCLVKS